MEIVLIWILFTLLFVVIAHLVAARARRKAAQRQRSLQRESPIAAETLLDLEQRIIPVLAVVGHQVRDGGVLFEGDLQTDAQTALGIGMLLERFPTDAIPVFVSGTYEAWPLGQRFPRLRPIRVLIGKPCNPQELMREGHEQKPHEKITNALQEKVAALIYCHGNPRCGRLSSND